MTVFELRAVIARLSGRNVWNPQGMMRKLAAELDMGAERLESFTLKRFGKVPEDLSPTETRSAIAFLRHVQEQDKLKGARD